MVAWAGGVMWAAWRTFSLAFAASACTAVRASTSGASSESAVGRSNFSTTASILSRAAFTCHTVGKQFAIPA
jgi:hypothetical protein